MSDGVGDEYYLRNIIETVVLNNENNAPSMPELEVAENPSIIPISSNGIGVQPVQVHPALARYYGGDNRMAWSEQLHGQVMSEDVFEYEFENVVTLEEKEGDVVEDSCVVCMDELKAPVVSCANNHQLHEACYNRLINEAHRGAECALRCGSRYRYKITTTLATTITTPPPLFTTYHALSALIRCGLYNINDAIKICDDANEQTYRPLDLFTLYITQIPEKLYWGSNSIQHPMTNKDVFKAVANLKITTPDKKREFFEFLLDNGADVQLKTRYDEEKSYLLALYNAGINRNWTPENANTQNMIIDVLVEKRSQEFNVRDEQGRSVLFKLTFYAKQLMENSAIDFSATDNNGNTLLHNLAKKNSEILTIPIIPQGNQFERLEDYLSRIVKKITSSGIDVNKKNNSGKTALYYTKTRSLVERLIEHGATALEGEDEWNEWFVSLFTSIYSNAQMQHEGRGVYIKNPFIASLPRRYQMKILSHLMSIRAVREVQLMTECGVVLEEGDLMNEDVLVNVCKCESVESLKMLKVDATTRALRERAVKRLVQEVMELKYHASEETAPLRAPFFYHLCSDMDLNAEINGEVFIVTLCKYVAHAARFFDIHITPTLHQYLHRYHNFRCTKSSLLLSLPHLTQAMFETLIGYFDVENIDDDVAAALIATNHEWVVSSVLKSDVGVIRKVLMAIVGEKNKKMVAKVMNVMQHRFFALPCAEEVMDAMRTALPSLYYYVEQFKDDTIVDTMCEAIQRGEMVEAQLCSVEEVVNATAANGDTMLYCAVVTKRIDIVEVLLKRGANANKKVRGKSVLFHAFEHYDKEVVRRMIDATHNVFDYDAQQNSYLHYAARCGADKDVVRALVEKGLRANMMNARGETPLDVCATSEAVEVMMDYI